MEVSVAVGVRVGVAVLVKVGVLVGVLVIVGVTVGEPTISTVGVAVGSSVGVLVGVACAHKAVPTPSYSAHPISIRSISMVLLKYGLPSSSRLIAPILARSAGPFGPLTFMRAKGRYSNALLYERSSTISPSENFCPETSPS